MFRVFVFSTRASVGVARPAGEVFLWTVRL